MLLFGYQFIDQVQRRAGHESRYQGHQHHHREHLRRKHTQVVPDIENDQLHEASGVHQYTDGKTVFPALPDDLCRQGAAAEFAG